MRAMCIVEKIAQMPNVILVCNAARTNRLIVVTALDVLLYIVVHMIEKLLEPFDTAIGLNLSRLKTDAFVVREFDPHIAKRSDDFA